MSLLKPIFAGEERRSGDMPTPSEIQRRRAMAERLLDGGGQTENISHPLQLAAGLLQSGIGAWQLSKANRDEEAGREYRNKAWLDAYDQGFFGGSIGGGSSGGRTTMGAPSAPIGSGSASIPSGERAGYMRQGMVRRGLPEHVADAFLLNFQDESGLDPGINERNPIVPGSRGGFGLYQLTGPRRVAYERFASNRGAAFDDIDTQLDFLGGEMGLPGLGLENEPFFGSESRAAQSILGSRDTSSAAQAVVHNFLRPSPEHRTSRAARYASLAGNMQGIQTPGPSLQQEAEALQPQIQGVQVASLGPNEAMASALGAQPANISPANQALATALARDGAPIASQAQSTPNAPSPTLMAQAQAMTGGQMPSPAPGVDRAMIARLLSNPWTEDLGQSFLMQQMEAWQRDSDPLRQIQIQAAQQELQRGQPMINAGGGQLYDPNRREWITAPGVGQGSNLPDSFQTLQLRAEAAGLVPGSPEFQSFMANGGRSSEDSAAEQRIGRMTENLMQTGDFIDPMEARNVAVGIVDGRLRTDRHPITGAMQIVDMATGRPAYGGSPEPQAPESQQMLPAPQMPMGEADRFGTQYQSGPQAFGVEGAARRVLNTVGDATGFGAPYPETQAAQADYSVLQESVLNDIAGAYGRQPPSWLLQEIRSLTPTPGSPFEGPGSAVAKLNAIGRHLLNELRLTEQSLGRNLSPTQQQEAEARLSGLQSAIARIDGAVASFGGEPEMATEGQSFQEGATATNPDTGARIIFRNGQWEPLQ